MPFSTLVILLFATLAVAAPRKIEKEICSTSGAKLVLPAGQTALAEPSVPLSFVILGIGLQNYTCNSTGSYASAGAVADLFDLSCLSEKNQAAFESIQDSAYESWSTAPSNNLDDVLGKKYKKLGAHFFIKNSSGGISPVWDFRADAAPNNLDAFVLAAKVAGLKAPTGSQDVDWLELKGVSGGLATSIYRTHTKGGQPPATCTPGSNDIQVKYVSKYWLYGNTVTLSCS